MQRYCNYRELSGGVSSVPGTSPPGILLSSAPPELSTPPQKIALLQIGDPKRGPERAQKSGGGLRVECTDYRVIFLNARSARSAQKNVEHSEERGVHYRMGSTLIA